jgi:hypothetical protein
MTNEVASNNTLPPVIARLTSVNRSNLGGAGDCQAWGAMTNYMEAVFYMPPLFS